MNNDTDFFLFGSAARGDADDASDIDVLVIYSDDTSHEARQESRNLISSKLGDRAAIAEYSKDRICHMFSEGQLFAWHLYLESKPLSFHLGLDKSDNGFAAPAPYNSGRADAVRFIDLLRSTAFEVNNRRGYSEVHEAGLIYLCLRNISMSLSYSYCSLPDFSRHSTFSLSSAAFISPPCDLNTFNLLINARHSSQRGLPEPFIVHDSLSRIATDCLIWAELILEKYDERNRNQSLWPILQTG